MGSKRLKAVAVRGSKKVPFADPAKYQELRQAWLKNLQQLDTIPALKSLSSFGTCPGLSGLIVSGGAPIKNWRLIGAECFPEHAKISGDAIFKYQTKKSGCFACPIACGGSVTVGEGPYQVKDARKTEYETLAALGSLCFNTSAESIIKGSDICDRYGIDTISAGTVIAFAMECYEKRILTKNDTDGLDLSWGNSQAIISLLEKMGKREGFGAVLADGVVKAAQRIGKGSAEFAMNIGGQEPGCHDPRFNIMRGLNYTASPRPGRHNETMAAARLDREQNMGTYPELTVVKDSEQHKNKSFVHALSNNYFQTFSNCGMCQYAITPGTKLPLVELVSAVTGWDFTASEAITTGKRIQTLRHLFNLREGITPGDFSIPERMAKPPETGPYKGKNVDFQALRKEYFNIMGWDNQTGVPTDKCLAELGLKS